MPEEGWERSRPRRELTRDEVIDRVGHLVGTDLAMSPLAGGLASTAVRVTSPRGQLVLRVPGQDTARKEVAAMARARVPVPPVLDAGEDWLALGFVEGRRLADVLPADAAHWGAEVGRVAAAMRDAVYPSAGFVDDDLALREPLDVPETWRRMVGEALDRMELPDVRGWFDDTPLPVAPPYPLLHGDFKPTNLLVRDGRVVAVLDWEFAWAGPFLASVGQMLRWEHHYPAFRDGFTRTVGALPTGWRRTAAGLDLLNLLQFLEQPGPRRRTSVLDCLQRVVALR